jgi:hypothetical protein
MPRFFCDLLKEAQHVVLTRVNEFIFIFHTNSTLGQDYIVKKHEYNLLTLILEAFIERHHGKLKQE